MVWFYAPWSVFSKAVLLVITLYYEIPLSLFNEDIATGMKNSYVVATLDVAKYKDISDR
ncbi:hypothetical protein MKX03_009176 [Papaver bracteatum]|nr:hypothetical protein MKX03_009176 [Papaver bracteatum]